MEARQRIFLNQWFLLMIALGAFSLLSSLLSVNFLDLNPCLMCKLQRLPFLVLGLTAILGVAGTTKKAYFKVTQICLCIGLILGITHFLVQMGTLPDFCLSRRDFSSPEEFSKILVAAKCSEISWSIFGLPVSFINAIVHGTALWGSVYLKNKSKITRGTL